MNPNSIFDINFQFNIKSDFQMYIIITPMIF